MTLAGARIVVVRGSDRGHALRITKEVTRIGTAASCDLVLHDDTVSQHHIALRALPESFLATDLGSTNGTFASKLRVESVHLGYGDTLDLGRTRIRLEPLPDATEWPLGTSTSFGKLLGRSVESRRLFATLEAVARRDATVLLVGETGTGKDLAAQAIHDASDRADKPFVVVDCSALPSTLMEAELFGHERGAFTGAHRNREGALAEADGGTIFFDEIAKLPYDMQPKLLRALENREVRPLGSSKSVSFDVRVIAASDRDLGAEVNRGAFREDLFYRLNVVSVRLPALRERPDDIPLLANHFYRELTGDQDAALPAHQLSALLVHAWPGNVRELRNAVERMVVLADVGGAPAEVAVAEGGAGADGAPEPAPAAAPGTLAYKAARAKAMGAFERAFLIPLIAKAEGNVSLAARMAGMDRVTLIKLLRKHGLSRRSIVAGE